MSTKGRKHQKVDEVSGKTSSSSEKCSVRGDKKSAPVRGRSMQKTTRARSASQVAQRAASNSADNKPSVKAGSTRLKNGAPSIPRSVSLGRVPQKNVLAKVTKKSVSPASSRGNTPTRGRMGSGHRDDSPRSTTSARSNSQSPARSGHVPKSKGRASRIDKSKVAQTKNIPTSRSSSTDSSHNQHVRDDKINANSDGSQSLKLVAQETADIGDKSVITSRADNQEKADLELKSPKGTRKKNVKDGKIMSNESTTPAESPKMARRGVKKKVIQEKDSALATTSPKGINAVIPDMTESETSSTESPKGSKGKNSNVGQKSTKKKPLEAADSATSSPEFPRRAKSKGSEIGQKTVKKNTVQINENVHSESPKSTKLMKNKATKDKEYEAELSVSPRTLKGKGTQLKSARSKVIKNKEDDCLTLEDLGDETVMSALILNENKTIGKSKKKINKKKQGDLPMSFSHSLDQDHNYFASPGLNIPQDTGPVVPRPRGRPKASSPKNAANKTPIRTPKGNLQKVSSKQVQTSASKDKPKRGRKPLSNTSIKSPCMTTEVEGDVQADEKKPRKCRSRSKRKATVLGKSSYEKDDDAVETKTGDAEPDEHTLDLAADFKSVKSRSKLRKLSTKTDIVERRSGPQTAMDVIQGSSLVDTDVDDVSETVMKSEAKEQDLVSPRARGRQRKAYAVHSKADACNALSTEAADNLASPTARWRGKSDKGQTEIDKTVTALVKEETKTSMEKEVSTRQRTYKKKTNGPQETAESTDAATDVEPNDTDPDTRISLQDEMKPSEDEKSIIDSKSSSQSKDLGAEVEMASTKEVVLGASLSRGRPRKTSVIPIKPVSDSEIMADTNDVVLEMAVSGRPRRIGVVGKEQKVTVASESDDSSIKKTPGRLRKSVLQEDDDHNKSVPSEGEIKLLCVKQTGSRRSSNASSTTKTSQTEDKVSVIPEPIAVTASLSQCDPAIETDILDNMVHVELDNTSEKTDLDSSGSSQSLIDIFKHTIALRQQLAKERHKWQKPDDEMSTTSSVDGSTKGGDRKNVFDVFSCPDSGAGSEDVMTGSDHPAGENIQKISTIRRASSSVPSKLNKIDGKPESEIEKVTKPRSQPQSRRSSGLMSVESLAVIRDKPQMVNTYLEDDVSQDEKPACHPVSRRSSTAMSVEESSQDSVDETYESSQDESMPGNKTSHSRKRLGRHPRHRIDSKRASLLELGSKEESEIDEPSLSSASIRRGRVSSGRSRQSDIGHTVDNELDNHGEGSQDKETDSIPQLNAYKAKELSDDMWNGKQGHGHGLGQPGKDGKQDSHEFHQNVSLTETIQPYPSNNEADLLHSDPVTACNEPTLMSTGTEDGILVINDPTLVSAPCEQGQTMSVDKPSSGNQEYGITKEVAVPSSDASVLGDTAMMGKICPDPDQMDEPITNEQPISGSPATLTDGISELIQPSSTQSDGTTMLTVSALPAVAFSCVGKSLPDSHTHAEKEQPVIVCVTAVENIRDGSLTALNTDVEQPEVAVLSGSTKIQIAQANVSESVVMPTKKTTTEKNETRPNVELVEGESFQAAQRAQSDLEPKETSVAVDKSLDKSADVDRKPAAFEESSAAPNDLPNILEIKPAYVMIVPSVVENTSAAIEAKESTVECKPTVAVKIEGSSTADKSPIVDDKQVFVSTQDVIGNIHMTEDTCGLALDKPSMTEEDVPLIQEEATIGKDKTSTIEQGDSAVKITEDMAAGRLDRDAESQERSDAPSTTTERDSTPDVDQPTEGKRKRCKLKRRSELDLLNDVDGSISRRRKLRVYQQAYELYGEKGLRDNALAKTLLGLGKFDAENMSRSKLVEELAQNKFCKDQPGGISSKVMTRGKQNRFSHLFKKKKRGSRPVSPAGSRSPVGAHTQCSPGRSEIFSSDNQEVQPKLTDFPATDAPDIVIPSVVPVSTDEPTGVPIDKPLSIETVMPDLVPKSMRSPKSASPQSQSQPEEQKPKIKQPRKRMKPTGSLDYNRLSGSIGYMVRYCKPCSIQLIDIIKCLDALKEKDADMEDESTPAQIIPEVDMKSSPEETKPSTPGPRGRKRKAQARKSMSPAASIHSKLEESPPAKKNPRAPSSAYEESFLSFLQNPSIPSPSSPSQEKCEAEKSPPPSPVQFIEEGTSVSFPAMEQDIPESIVSEISHSSSPAHVAPSDPMVTNDVPAVSTTPDAPSTTADIPVQPRRSMRSTMKNVYRCLFCKYTCHIRKIMEDHVYNHMDIIPYMCGLCYAIFGTRGGVLVHNRRSHPGHQAVIIKKSEVDETQYYTTVEDFIEKYGDIASVLPAPFDDKTSSLPPPEVLPALKPAKTNVKFYNELQLSPSILCASDEQKQKESPKTIKSIMESTAKSSSPSETPVVRHAPLQVSVAPTTITSASHQSILPKGAIPVIISPHNLSMSGVQQTPAVGSQQQLPAQFLVQLSPQGLQTSGSTLQQTSGPILAVSGMSSPQLVLQLPLVAQSQASPVVQQSLTVLATAIPAQEQPLSPSNKQVIADQSETRQPSSEQSNPVCGSVTSSPITTVESMDHSTDVPSIDITKPTDSKTSEISVNTDTETITVPKRSPIILRIPKIHQWKKDYSESSDDALSTGDSESRTVEDYLSGSDAVTEQGVQADKEEEDINHQDMTTDQQDEFVDEAEPMDDDLDPDEAHSPMLKIVSVCSLADNAESGSLTGTSQNTETPPDRDTVKPTATQLLENLNSMIPKTVSDGKLELDEVWQCQNCKENTRLYDVMVDHIHTVHKKTYWYACPYCPFGCSQPRFNMYRHMRRTHPQKEDTIFVGIIDGDRYFRKKTVGVNVLGSLESNDPGLVQVSRQLSDSPGQHKNTQGSSDKSKTSNNNTSNIVMTVSDTAKSRNKEDEEPIFPRSDKKTIKPTAHVAPAIQNKAPIENDLWQEQPRGATVPVYIADNQSIVQNAAEVTSGGEEMSMSCTDEGQDEDASCNPAQNNNTKQHGSLDSLSVSDRQPTSSSPLTATVSPSISHSSTDRPVVGINNAQASCPTSSVTAASTSSILDTTGKPKPPPLIPLGIVEASQVAGRNRTDVPPLQRAPGAGVPSNALPRPAHQGSPHIVPGSQSVSAAHVQPTISGPQRPVHTTLPMRSATVRPTVPVSNLHMAGSSEEEEARRAFSVFNIGARMRQPSAVTFNGPPVTPINHPVVVEQPRALTRPPPPQARPLHRPQAYPQSRPQPHSQAPHSQRPQPPNPMDQFKQFQLPPRPQSQPTAAPAYNTHVPNNAPPPYDAKHTNHALRHPPPMAHRGIIRNMPRLSPAPTHITQSQPAHMRPPRPNTMLPAAPRPSHMDGSTFSRWTCPYCQVPNMMSKSLVEKHIRNCHPDQQIVYVPYSM